MDAITRRHLKDWRLWFNAIFLPIIFMAIAAVLVLPLIPPSWGEWRGWITVVVAGLLFYGYAYRGYTKGLRHDLRRDLYQRGIPVCHKCGYCLRGVDPLVCPECGTAFDPEAYTD